MSGPALATSSGPPQAAGSQPSDGAYIRAEGPCSQAVVAASLQGGFRAATAGPSCSAVGRGLRVANPEAHLLLTNVDPEMPNEAREEGSGAAPSHSPPWGRICLKICITIALFLAVTCSLEKFAKKPVERFSTKLMNRIGLPGLFLGVLLADGVPQPFTYVPLIFMAVKGSVPQFTVFLICAAGSYLAAILGYMAGQCLRRPQWGRDWFARLSTRYPYLPELMKKRGAIGVLLAAMLPLPLALSTWMAGFFNMKLRHFLGAALGRWPKILVFVLLSGSSSQVLETYECIIVRLQAMQS